MVVVRNTLKYLRTYPFQKGGDDRIHPNHLTQRIKRTKSQKVDQELSRRLGPFELVWAINQLLRLECNHAEITLENMEHKEKVL